MLLQNGGIVCFWLQFYFRRFCIPFRNARNEQYDRQPNYVEEVCVLNVGYIISHSGWCFFSLPSFIWAYLELVQGLLFKFYIIITHNIRPFPNNALYVYR
jgi:hypothetical protein